MGATVKSRAAPAAGSQGRTGRRFEQDTPRALATMYSQHMVPQYGRGPVLPSGPGSPPMQMMGGGMMDMRMMPQMQPGYAMNMMGAFFENSGARGTLLNTSNG